MITLPSAESIMSAQTGENVDGYTLENLELEYETIDSQELAQEISSKYDLGRSPVYEHITHIKTLNWSKDSTIENETINFPRKSFRAVVMLFKNKTITDSEEFVFPNIETVKITIEGTPSQIYSQGIPKNRFYNEAKRLFGNGAENRLMTIRSFFKKHFALVIDLRNIEDKQRLSHWKKAHLNTIRDTTRNPKEGDNRGRRLPHPHHRRWYGSSHR